MKNEMYKFALYGFYLSFILVAFFGAFFGFVMVCLYDVWKWPQNGWKWPKIKALAIVGRVCRRAQNGDKTRGVFECVNITKKQAKTHCKKVG